MLCIFALLRTGAESRGSAYTTSLHTQNKKVKDGWVETIEKHHTRFFIGSNNVAQFFPIRDTSVNLLASNITK